MSKIVAGKKEIPCRLRIKDIRRAKSDHGIDLSQFSEDAPVIKLNTDPLVLLDVVWALYEPQWVDKGVKSKDELEDLISDNQMDALREAVVNAVSGFFPLIKTVYTAMQGVLDGNIDLKQAMEEAAKQTNPSGMNS